MEEYEEALRRYTSWGLMGGDAAGALEDDENEEDDVTPEQMVEWSRLRLDASRAATDPSMMAAPAAPLEFTVENVDRVFDQGLIALEHPAIGAHQLLLVAVDQDDGGRVYEAVFTRVDD